MTTIRASNTRRELLRLCHARDTESARALWHTDAALIGDVNAPVFGADEPLLCAFARGIPLHTRLALFGGEICTFLVAEAGADPNRPNAAGETPLALAALRVYLQDDFAPPITLGHIQRIAAALGGADEASAFEGGVLLRGCIRLSELTLLTDLAPRLRAAVHKPPLMHFLMEVHADSGERLLLRAARVLIDDYGQDALERDAEGRTLAELPSTSPALRELLADAPLHLDSVTAALGLALHPRLGAASPLHALDAELLRDFVLPHCAPPPAGLLARRAARLDAFAAAEGLRLDNSLFARYEYAFCGAPFNAPHFRVQHLLTHDLAPELRARIALAMLDAIDADSVRLWLRAHAGLDFAAPYSPAFAVHAVAAITAALEAAGA